MANWLSPYSLLHRVVHPALGNLALGFLACALLVLPEAALQIARESGREAIAVSAGLICLAALLWTLAFSLAFFVARLLHAAAGRVGIPIALFMPGLIVFLLLGYPTAVWLLEATTSGSVVSVVSVGSMVASASVSVGVVLLLAFPQLRETTGCFALVATVLSRLLLLPFERMIGYEGWGAALLALASVLLAAGFYVAFRTRFAYQTAGQLQVLGVPRVLVWLLGVLTAVAWASAVALGRSLPDRLTAADGAMWSLGGLLCLVCGLLSLMSLLHLLGFARRIVREMPSGGRSAYWFVPACILFACSGLLHLQARPPTAETAGRLRADSLIGYDLLASLPPGLLPGRVLPATQVAVGSSPPELDLPRLQIPPRARTVVVLSVFGLHSLPKGGGGEAVFLGTDRSEGKALRLMGSLARASFGDIDRFAQGFEQNGFRTVCGGWDGGRGYLGTQAPARLDKGCQIHLPLRNQQTPTFAETAEVMLRALAAYREKRTFAWFHFESAEGVSRGEVEKLRRALSQQGLVLTAYTTLAEPSLGHLSFPTFRGKPIATRPAADEPGPLKVPMPKVPGGYAGTLFREYRPTPLLGYRAFLGSLPAIAAHVRGPKLYLWDRTGGARWERELTVSERAAQLAPGPGRPLRPTMERP